ncbi:MAG: DUF839 domain-containing protein [Hahellaceae bacterium]|nr:DUF839 domain-containing protein [Hahellaceae bacterium]
MTTNFKLKLLVVAVSSSVLLAACGGDDGKDGADGVNGKDLAAAPKLTRIATVPLGAEITGIFKTDNGELFFNVQHPDDTLPAPENNAAVGAWVGVDFDNLDPMLTDIPVPATGSDEAKTVQVIAGSYQALGRAGDTFSGALPFGFGATVNAAGNGLVRTSQDPDFNAYIASNVDGSEGYLFTAFENRPGAMSRLALARQTDGTWAVNNAMNIDFSAVAGTLINCFGTVTPWGTPLTSEENYEAENTVNWNNTAYSSGYPNYADVQFLQQYLGGTFPNPYDYGYIVEITQPAAAAPVPVKHFTLGRVAHENVVVMPDKKTVYITDDGSDKGFYKFIANTAGDLSAGTIYAAKLSQDATKDISKAGFDIEWIALGSSSNAEIESWINQYDGIDESNYVEGQTSYITDAEITDWAVNNVGDDRYAFLETLRAAKAKGATVEFRKMEGININYAGVASGAVPYMYVAMSEVAKGMSDNKGDIQLAENKCGAVYRFGIMSDYNVSRMEPVLVGGAYDATAAENACSVEGISNPDNLVVLNDGRVIVGEDTSKHSNNMMWVFNPQGK